MTSRETLMRDSNSMLARLVSDSDLISDKVNYLYAHYFLSHI